MCGFIRRTLQRVNLAQTQDMYTELTLFSAFGLGLFRAPNSLAVTLSDAPDQVQLPDSTAYWIGYPLYRQTIPYRRNLLMLERWKLTKYTWELMDLLFSAEMPQRSKPELCKASEALAEKIERWYSEIHPELRYAANMPAGLYEFQ